MQNQGGLPQETRGRANVDRNCDRCLRPMATPGMGMGAGRCRRCHWWCCDRRCHHRLPTARLCGVPRLRTAGLRTRVLLGIPACLRRCRSRRRVYGPTGTGLPWLCSASAARRCRNSPAGCTPAQMIGEVPARYGMPLKIADLS